MNDTRRRSVAAATCGMVAIVVVFDVALHRLCGWAFHFDYFDNGLPHSLVFERGLFPLAASLGFCLLFGFTAVAFWRSRAALGGSSLAAGQRFFAPIALVMFFGVLESAFVFPTPFKPEIITAVADAVPFLLLGLLLSRLDVARRAGGGGPGGKTAAWTSAPWVALFFVAGRYLVSYPLLGIVSGYVARPIGTFAWTVSCGLAMGAFYWLAGSAFTARSPARRATRVGITLGCFWLMVQLFYALISAVALSDLAIRGTADIVYLVVAIYAYEMLFRRKTEPNG